MKRERMKLIADITRERRVGDASLTRREWQVFIGLATGKRGRALAAEMATTPSNVGTIRNRLLVKLDLYSDVEVAALAIHHGIVKVQP